MELLVPSPMAFADYLCDDQAPQSKCLLTALMLGTLLQSLLALLRLLKWVGEFLANWMTLAHTMWSADDMTIDVTHKAADPLPTVYSLDFSDPELKVHLRSDCTHIKFKNRVPDSRQICVQLFADNVLCATCVSKARKNKFM